MSAHTYYGQPCRHGHTLRYKAGRGCVECTQQARRERDKRLRSTGNEARYRRIWTDEETKHAIALRANGASLYVIAEALGRSPGAVENKLQHVGRAKGREAPRVTAWPEWARFDIHYRTGESLEVRETRTKRFIPDHYHGLGGSSLA